MYIHTYIHIYIHTYMCVYIHICSLALYTHTHTHMQKYNPMLDPEVGCRNKVSDERLWTAQVSYKRYVCIQTHTHTHIHTNTHTLSEDRLWTVQVSFIRYVCMSAHFDPCMCTHSCENWTFHVSPHVREKDEEVGLNP